MFNFDGVRRENPSVFALHLCVRKLTSFTLCCYVICLLNRAQTNDKHKRKGMWFGCEQPFLFFLGGVGGGGALRDIPKNGCGGD